MSDEIQVVAEDAIVIDVYGTPIVLELKDTKVAEQSVCFLRTVNPGTYPDLITVFNLAIKELVLAVGTLKTALFPLEHKLKYMKADIIWNRLPAIAAQKGIKLTAPQAEA